MKSVKRWLEYLDWFKRGFPIESVAKRFGVTTDTVERAIRHYLRPGGRRS